MSFAKSLTFAMIAAGMLVSAQVLTPIHNPLVIKPILRPTRMDLIPMPNGHGRWIALKETITAASSMAQVNVKTMAVFAAVESGFRPHAEAKSTTATGLYQFTQDTWTRLIARYGNYYGIKSDTPMTDARANALLAAEFLKHNESQIKTVKKGAINNTDLYLAHLLGTSGAKRFIRAQNDKPNQKAATLFRTAAKNNAALFYDEDAKARTLAGVYRHITRMLADKTKAFELHAVT